MYLLDPSLARALMELNVKEAGQLAFLDNLRRQAKAAQPGWFSRQGSRLLNHLGTWLVALGAELLPAQSPGQDSPPRTTV
jgi:hypothetical protein